MNSLTQRKITRLSAGCVLALAAAVLQAQPASAAKTARVKGLVTVSEGNVVRTARDGAPVANGSRIVTSSNASARISLDNACEIALSANQSVIVDYDKSCDALIASIQSMESRGMAFVLPREAAGGILLLLGGATLAGGSPTATSPGGGGPIPSITPE